MTTLREELEMKGFTLIKDDQTILLQYKGLDVAMFGYRAKPESIRKVADQFLRNCDLAGIGK